MRGRCRSDRCSLFSNAGETASPSLKIDELGVGKGFRAGGSFAFRIQLFGARQHCLESRLGTLFGLLHRFRRRLITQLRPN